jgi:hypothetical protein
MYWTVKFNGDPNETLETEELEQQFLIKWKGWSHINNTWESEKSIGKSPIYFCWGTFYLACCGTVVLPVRYRAIFFLYGTVRYRYLFYYKAKLIYLKSYLRFHFLKP